MPISPSLPLREEHVQEKGVTDNLEALRLRLRQHANRVVVLTAITNEKGELIGFAIQSAHKIERVSS